MALRGALDLAIDVSATDAGVARRITAAVGIDCPWDYVVHNKLNARGLNPPFEAATWASLEGLLTRAAPPEAAFAACPHPCVLLP